MELVTIKAKTRGKGTRNVEYKGVGKFVTDEGETEPRLIVAGICTDIKDALEAEGGNMQALLDNWAVGFNAYAYKECSDQLAEFIKPSWSDATVLAFRQSVNGLLKLNMSLEQAVKVALAAPVFA